MANDDNWPVVFDVAPVYAPLVESDKRFNILTGGRGSGKSVHMAKQGLRDGMTQRMEIMYTRAVEKSIAKSCKAELDHLIRENEYLSWFYRSLQYKIVGRNGTEITFPGMGTNAQSLRGFTRAERVFIDEAQDISRYAWETLRPTIRSDTAQIFMAINPTREADPIYADFIESDKYPGRSLVIEANYTENPWFPKALEGDRLANKENMDPLEYAHIWDGRLSIRSSELVIPPSAWRIDEVDGEEGSVHFGLDLGFVNDPSVGVRVRVIQRADARALLYIEREVAKKGLQYGEIRAFLAPLAAQQGDVIQTDHQIPPGDMGDYKLRLAKKGPGSVAAGIRRILSCEIVVHPSCEQVIHDFRNYRYKRDAATDQVMPDAYVKGDDHAPDAIRYSLESWSIARLRSGRKRGGYSAMY